MQQIELYYTYNLKYLKLGDYVRYFEQESIDDMLACIKNQETPVKIRTTKEYLIPHKLSDKSKVIYTYEEIEEEKIFDYDKVQFDGDTDLIELNETIVKQDLKALYDGITDYVKYSVKPEWQNVLGKVVYLVKDRELQRNIIDKQDTFAFMLDDLSELVEGLKRNGEIPQKVLLKCFFDGKEIEVMHHVGEVG